MSTPYRITPIFTQDTLPNGLRAQHNTKAGVWGIIRVLEGALKLTYLEPRQDVILTPQQPGLILPEQQHFVTPLGDLKMQVEFYDHPPAP